MRPAALLGSEQAVHATDTLSLRCYTQEGFARAMALAGFAVEWIEDLVLPVRVSVVELGIKAVVVSLARQAAAPAEAGAISAALLPSGESSGEQGGPDAELEYWMAVNHAKDLVEKGELPRALRTLEYAVNFSKSVTIDVRDLLDRVVREIGARGQKSRARELLRKALRRLRAAQRRECLKRTWRSSSGAFQGACGAERAGRAGGDRGTLQSGWTCALRGRAVLGPRRQAGERCARLGPALPARR